MHPEILRELNSQRGREMRARAHTIMLARKLRAMRRSARNQDEADDFVVPAIPDYVDGSFQAAPADDHAASQPDRMPASRHAA
jgi:hypothetical protein